MFFLTVVLECIIILIHRPHLHSMILIDQVQWRDMNCSELFLHLVWMALYRIISTVGNAVGYNLTPQAIGIVTLVMVEYHLMILCPA